MDALKEISRSLSSTKKLCDATIMLISRNLRMITVKGIYKIWRKQNLDIFPNMTANILANQRRFIERQLKLSEKKLSGIKKCTQNS